MNRTLFPISSPLYLLDPLVTYSICVTINFCLCSGRHSRIDRAYSSLSSSQLSWKLDRNDFLLSPVLPNISCNSSVAKWRYRTFVYFRCHLLSAVLTVGKKGDYYFWDKAARIFAVIFVLATLSLRLCEPFSRDLYQPSSRAAWNIPFDFKLSDTYTSTPSLFQHCRVSLI